MSIFTKFTKLHVDTLDADNNVITLAHSKVLDTTDTHLIIEMPTHYQYQMLVSLKEVSSLLIKFESINKVANAFIVKTFDEVDYQGQKALRVDRPKNKEIVKYNRRKGTRVNLSHFFINIQNAQTSRKERVEVIDICSKGFISVKASKSFLYALRIQSNVAAAVQTGLMNIDGTFLYGQAKIDYYCNPETAYIPVKSFKVVTQFDSDKNVRLLLELDLSTYEKTLLETFIRETLTNQLLEDSLK